MKVKLDRKPMFHNAPPASFGHAETNRENATKAEAAFWNLVKRKRLGEKFRRQHPLGQFIIDFYCHSARLAVEIDGGYHKVPKQKERDDARDADLEGKGIKTLRFANEEVLNQEEKVKQILIAEVQKRVK